MRVWRAVEYAEAPHAWCPRTRGRRLRQLQRALARPSVAGIYLSLDDRAAKLFSYLDTANSGHLDRDDAAKVLGAMGVSDCLSDNRQSV